MSSGKHKLRFDMPDDQKIKSPEIVIPLVQGILRRNGWERSEFDLRMTKRKRIRVDIQDAQRVEEVISLLQEKMKFMFVPKISVAETVEEDNYEKNIA